MLDACYLCGSRANLTKDHVPPENLFPPPKPQNLITVPCCAKCNEDFSKDDEAFRLWVSTSIFRSPAGDWIWQNKVIPSMGSRNKKLAANIQEYVGSRTLATPIGNIDVPVFSIPTERAIRYIIRITKGLLRHFHPEYNYIDTPFHAEHLLPTPEAVGLVTKLTRLLIYDERGDGVFRFWRGFPADAPQNGVWLYLFFDGACFVVLHGDNVEIPKVA